MSDFALVHCRQLATLGGSDSPRIGAEMSEIGLVEDGALIVKNGRVDWAGKTDEMPGFKGKILSAAGYVVTPGFVDCHTHLVFGGDRAAEFEARCAGATYQEIAASGGGIQATVAATRALSPDGLVARGVKHARWMLACGTTTIEAKSGYGLTKRAEFDLLRASLAAGRQTGANIVATFLGAHCVPPEFDDAKVYAEYVIDEMIPAVAEEKLAEFVDVFCEEGYFDVATSRRILLAAKKKGLAVKLHADQLTNGGGAQLAAELRAVSADHLEQTDSEGIQSLEQARVIPVLLPASVHAIGLSKYADARAMIAAGLPVALATDFNPGTSPTPSLPMTMHLACLKMKMTPAECLTAVTVNAAHAIKRGREVGSLEPGKRADFAMWEIDDYRDLAYYFGAMRAARVFAKGILVSQEN